MFFISLGTAHTVTIDTHFLLSLDAVNDDSLLTHNCTMTNTNMMISIITPCYNSAETIQDTLRTVGDQTYPNVDHVIIDGNSQDDTLAIIGRESKDSRLISEPDKGIYDAMNKGIQIAKGDIIGILNSDDFYTADTVLSDVMEIFQDPKIDAVYGDLIYVDDKDTSKVIRNWKSGKYKYSGWKLGWMPPHPTFFLRKEFYDKFGLYNLSLKSAADYELMLRMCYKHKITLGYLPKTVVSMRIGGQSNASLKNRLSANREDRLAWKINKLNPAFYTTILKPLRKLYQFVS